MARTLMGWWRPSRRAYGGRAARVANRVSRHVTGLRVLLGSGPTPEFRARLREELLRNHAAERTTAVEPPPAFDEVAGAPGDAPGGLHRRRPRRRPLIVRLRPVLVFAGLMVLMFATGVRTYDSVPGEPLYPLKRAAESTVLSLAYDDEDRAQREMAAARLRAAETASLVAARTRDRHRLITQTLDDMESTTRAALSRVAPRAEDRGEVRRFAREQHSLVEPLLPKLDRENRDKANKYLSYIDTMTASSGPSGP
ncbi:hypothetical protein JOL79_26310 [Microbispora sp. RL4-1S]|uniref:DUF5667 domain-containing protein n=1 Tax=Microbispora oryzae TaxID=2806554 RepID=A0A940WPR1_9ACTN|nr:DUF5667 domain-containing protein [Microbispora oryzae]MBP2707302.1 hypothetical protein [Microbispora oryzae]